MNFCPKKECCKRFEEYLIKSSYMYLLNLDFLNHAVPLFSTHFMAMRCCLLHQSKASALFTSILQLRSVKHSDLLWHTPITTVVMSLGDNGQLSIINLCHAQNLMLVKSVCKTVPKSLFCAPTGVRVPRSEYVS